MQVHAGACRSMQVHAGACRCMQVHAGACRCMQVHAGACRCMQVHAGACRCMQVHAGACRCMQVHAGACRCMQVHAGACRCMQVHAGACRCIQVHSGAFRCIQVHSGACAFTYSWMQCSLANIYDGIAIDKQWHKVSCGYSRNDVCWILCYVLCMIYVYCCISCFGEVYNIFRWWPIKFSQPWQRWFNGPIPWRLVSLIITTLLCNLYSICIYIIYNLCTVCWNTISPRAIYVFFNKRPLYFRRNSRWQKTELSRFGVEIDSKQNGYRKARTLCQNWENYVKSCSNI